MTNIIITEKEHKIGKESGNPYCRFKTQLGWCSAFDTDLINTLQEHVNTGVGIEVEITEKGQYKNIIGFDGIAKDNAPMGKPSEDKNFPKAPTTTTERNHAYDKDPIGLAVEVFSALAYTLEKSAISEEQLMKNCCLIVKIAQDNFK